MRTYADLLTLYESAEVWQPVAIDAAALKIDVLGQREDGTIEVYSEHLHEFESLKSTLAQAADQSFRAKVIDDLCTLFGRWRWPWRPRIDVLGGTNTGKLMLCKALAGIYGELVILTSDTTAAGWKDARKAYAEIRSRRACTVSRGRRVNYSYCESVVAGPRSPWHIRQLTEQGQKFGGGADTSALCGRVVSWDLQVPIAPQNIHFACKECRRLHEEAVSNPTKSRGDDDEQ